MLRRDAYREVKGERGRSPVDMLRQQRKGWVQFTSNAAATQSKAQAGASHHRWILAVSVLVNLGHTSFAVPQRYCLQFIVTMLQHFLHDRENTLMTNSTSNTVRILFDLLFDDSLNNRSSTQCCTGANSVLNRYVLWSRKIPGIQVCRLCTKHESVIAEGTLDHRATTASEMHWPVFQVGQPLVSRKR